MLMSCSGLDDGLILIEDEVVERLIPFRQYHSDAAEAGGILIGYRRGRHLHVVDATMPGVRDRRSRFEFQRKDSAHQRIALAHWKKSGRLLDYIGEWHTHPQSDPRPSRIDKSEWAKIVRDRCVPMIFAIVGLQTWWVGVGSDGHLVGASLSPS